MVILEAPYASSILLDWLEQSNHPVLANSFALGLGHDLNFVNDDQAARLVNQGQRVYTNSENALAWLLENTENPSLSKGIRVFKDKFATRRALASLDDGLFFCEYSIDELPHLNLDELPERFVLKPSVGFCSMGVHVITNEEEFQKALRSIEANKAHWNEMYPNDVVASDRFIIESYVEGQEYALDAYFDENGNAHVLNVLKHDFASAEATDDRMYTTSIALMDSLGPVFTDWLNEVNDILQIVDFPIHVEVRKEGDRIIPIEFNPLRFAGLGGTDVSHYAFGFKTYEAFLEGHDPDWDAIRRQRPSSVFTMALLGIPEDCSDPTSFDYEGFASRFHKVHEMRAFDPEAIGSLGFFFAELEAAEGPEYDFLLHDDLRSFFPRSSIQTRSIPL